MNCAYFFNNKFSLSDNKIITSTNEYKNDLVSITYLNKSFEVSKNLLKDVINNDGLYAYFIDLIKTSSTHLIINDISIPIIYIVKYLNSNTEREINIINLTSYETCKLHFYNETYIYKDYKIPTNDLFRMLDFNTLEYHMFIDNTETLSYHKDIMIEALKQFINDYNLLTKYDFSELEELLKLYNIPFNINMVDSCHCKINTQILKFNQEENFLYNYMLMCTCLDDYKEVFKMIINYLKYNNIFYQLNNKELRIRSLFVDINDITLKNNISLCHMNEQPIGVIGNKSLNIENIYNYLSKTRLTELDFMYARFSLEISEQLDLKKCLSIFIKAISKKDIQGLNIVSYIKNLKNIIFHKYKYVSIYIISKPDYKGNILIDVKKYVYFIDSKINIISEDKAKELKKVGYYVK